MHDNAAFKKLMIFFPFYYYLNVLCEDVQIEQEPIIVKQNSLKLHFGFCVFSHLMAKVADKYSFEIVVEEENSIYIFSHLEYQIQRTRFSTA